MQLKYICAALISMTFFFNACGGGETSSNTENSNNIENINSTEDINNTENSSTTEDSNNTENSATTEDSNTTQNTPSYTYLHSLIDLNSDGIIDLVQTKHYSIDGKLLEYKSGVYGLEPTTLIEEHNYDANGKILNETFSYSNQCHIYNQCKKTYTYTTNGKLLEVKEYDRNNELNATITTSYTYDFNDNITESITVDQYKNFTKKFFTYSSNNTLIDETVYTKPYPSSSYSLSYKLTKTYDNGILTQDHYTLNNGEIFFSYTNGSVSKITYLDNIGQEKQREEFYDINNTHLSNYYVYKFSLYKTLQLNMGNLLKVKSIDRDTLIETTEQYSYINDKISKMTRIANNITQTKVYTYNSDNKLIKIQDTTVNTDNNTTIGDITTTQEYNSYGDLTAKIKIDAIDPTNNSTSQYIRTYTNGILSSLKIIIDNIQKIYAEYFADGSLRFIDYRGSNPQYFRGQLCDYTKTTYIQINGKHLISSVLGSNNNGLSYDFENTYQYDTNGRLTEELRKENNITYLERHLEYENDELSKVIYADENYKVTELITRNNENSFYNILAMSPNTNLVSLKITHNMLTDKNEDIERFVYDGQNRLTNIIVYSPPYTYISSQTNISYDQYDRIIEKEVLGNQHIKTITQYNTDNTIKQENVYTYNWDGSISEDIYTYSYTIANNIKTATVNVTLADGTTDTIIKKYTLDNKLIAVDNSGTYSADYTYTYTDTGLPLKTTWITGSKTIDTEIYIYTNNQLQKYLYTNWQWNSDYSAVYYDAINYFYDTNGLITRTEQDINDDGSIESINYYYYVR